MKKQIFLQVLAALVVSLALVACGDKKKNSAGTPPPPGPAPLTCVPGTPGCAPNAPGTYKVYEGGLNITNPHIYKDVIRDWLLCEQYVWGNIGSAECTNWDNTGSFRLEVWGTGFPAQATATVIAIMNRGGYIVQPLPYSGTAYPTENNTQFELRAQGGYAGYNKILGAKANVGSLIVNNQIVQQMTVTLTYNGVEFATSQVILRW